MIPDLSNTQAWNRYSYVGNRPVNFSDPTGHSADCGLGDSYCGVGKINVAKRANDLYKNLPNRKGRNWISLSDSEKSILSEGGWSEGGFNDKGGVSDADALHDPATYIVGAVVSEGILKAGFGLLSSVMTVAGSTQLPSRLARVIPEKYVGGNTIGGPNAEDVFVTASDDIANISSSRQLAQRLALFDETGHLVKGPFAVLEFDTVDEIAIPILRNYLGFAPGGYTLGGAREYVIPNLSVESLVNLTTRIIK